MMTVNVGGPDRAARIIIGLVLMGLALTGTIGAWGWIGVIPFASGLFKACPLYLLFGLNTWPRRRNT